MSPKYQSPAPNATQQIHRRAIIINAIVNPLPFFGSSATTGVGGGAGGGVMGGAGSTGAGVSTISSIVSSAGSKVY